jgi:dihydrofolate synthase/folylpolyglutamate synthase
MSSWEAEGLSYRGIQSFLAGLTPGIPGRYQQVNAAAALCAAELLNGLGFVLSDQALRTGIDSARWPGRMEIIGTEPRFLLDGAHNAAGASALAESLEDVPHGRLFLVMGVMDDKDAEGMLDPLLPLAETVFAVSPAMERAMPSSELAALCRQRGAAAVDAGSVADGLIRSGNRAGAPDLVVVTGSLFAVGEARASILKQCFEPCRG